MEFRYDIGILRAIAVLVVLFFHFKIPGFDGGFLGVDVFFVISGFLMTKIVLSGFSRNQFSLLDFYVKRARRIIPPLLMVGLLVVLVSALLFFNRDAAQNAKNVALGSIFVSNIYFWLYNGYFDSASQDNIFLHSWSLAVEWQFYMLFPVLLLPLKNWYLRRRSWFNALFIGATLASFALCLYVTQQDNSFAFYMFPTRAWEMTLGGIAFLYADQFKQIPHRWRSMLALVGYFGILVSMFTIDETVLWPSAATLAPTLATFLVVATSAGFSWETWRPAQWVGDISYSLYLYHWPVFIIFKYFGMLDGVSIALMFAISFGLAAASYYLIETNRRFANVKFVGLALPVVMAACALLFLKPDHALIRTASIYDDKAYEIGNYGQFYDYNVRPNQYNSACCFVTVGDTFEQYKFGDCLTINPSKKNVLLLGDSHAAQFSQSFREMLPDSVHLLELSAGFTLPFPKPRGQESTVALVNAFYDDFLPENAKSLDLVVVSVHWPMHLNPQIGYSKTELLQGYAQMLSVFKALDVPVLVIGQHESYVLDYAKIVVLQQTFSTASDTLYAEKYKETYVAQYRDMIKEATPKGHFLDIYELPGLQKLSKDNVPYMVDKNHFSKFGADQVVQRLLGTILDNMRQ